MRSRSDRFSTALTGSVVLLTMLLAMADGLGSGPAADRSYFVYAAAESDDEVALIRYGPNGAEVLKTIPVGSFPADTEGPHGINVSPDGRYWFVSIAHGQPFGSVHKYETGSDQWVGDVTLGLFPATLDIAATTGLMYVVNFNLHGKMEPSSISVVETGTMIEIKRVPTGVMPHGSRLSRDGSRHYSVNMMDDDVVELDALRFKVGRKMRLEGCSAGRGLQHAAKGHESHHPIVQPTWVTPPTSSGKIYVAGNKSNTIFEIDLQGWRVVRRFCDTGAGPYNLGTTPDEKWLVVTYKKEGTVGFWELVTGQESRRIRTTRSVPHGIAISPDGKLAFVTVEGKGSEPGTVEIFDIPQRKRVGVVEMGKQAGGIAFWKMEP